MSTEAEASSSATFYPFQGWTNTVTCHHAADLRVNPDLEEMHQGSQSIPMTAKTIPTNNSTLERLTLIPPGAPLKQFTSPSTTCMSNTFKK
mmetsp:Transcript_3261/g.12444  ORF Transcript_3261/g.12444 Transcript_3261/m.12444 type:complete len:91 (-) Transcript_3261:812-1084(-)